MDRDDTRPAPQSADATIEATKVPAGAADDADTEGHSLTEELARSVNSDRTRSSERAARDSGRLRDARSGRSGGFLDRLRRR